MSIYETIPVYVNEEAVAELQFSSCGPQILHFFAGVPQSEEPLCCTLNNIDCKMLGSTDSFSTQILLIVHRLIQKQTTLLLTQPLIKFYLLKDKVEKKLKLETKFMSKN